MQGLLDTKEKIIQSMRDENRRNADMLVAAAETRKVGHARLLPSWLSLSSSIEFHCFRIQVLSSRNVCYFLTSSK